MAAPLAGKRAALTAKGRTATEARMSWPSPHDRRGRVERGATGLLGRESALEAIETALEHAGQRVGQALLIEGHAGLGKTRLHEAALDKARQRQFRVLRAAGAELERIIAFGVAAQLLTAQLNELSERRRKIVREGLPPRLRTLVGAPDEAEESGEGGDLAVVHGVFTMIASDKRPALIAIDDLQWCDAASLEFVLYVLHRLDELPVAVVLTGRTARGEEGSEVLDRIASHPRMRIETLSPLERDDVAQLASRELRERADASVIDACARATAGNPFYLRELLHALREADELDTPALARRALSLAPDAVIRSLRVRVGRLGRPAAALARAVVMLGDDVPLRHAASLADLDLSFASAAADALASVEILLPRDPLRFVHPLVRHAIAQDIPAAEFATGHFRAARLLHAEGAGPERVAAHLLLSHARRDGWVVEQLQAAAREARSRGVPQAAVRYLRRALEEPPPHDGHVELLAELGAAEAAAGLSEAAEHFQQAIAACGDPRRRAELALQHGRALDSQGRHELAARSYDAGLAELSAAPSDPEELELHDQLQADFVATATVVPALQAEALERSADLVGRAAAGPETQGQRLRLAQIGLHAAFQGEPAPKVLDLAERAWDGGRLLEHGTAQGIGWRFVSTLFTLAGDLERAVEIAGAALEDARRRGWPFAIATATYMRGLPLLWQCRVDDAISELELARESARAGWRQSARGAAAHYALALIEKGQLDEAEEILIEAGALEHPRDLEDVMRLHSLAELRLAQGRPREAFELACRSGAIAEQTVKYFGYCPWRTTAAAAALALDQCDRALPIAREAAQRADRTQVHHLQILTRRLLALCRDGPEKLASLRRAAALAQSGPPRLETVKTLVELGAALRRANQRSAAREPLQRAADMAWAGGATALHARARTELAATGARPRRDMLLSGPDSLTPSERRIAELAATGHSNREIAQTLFVTPKTVEYHLRNAYRKLDIDGRARLVEVLAV
jgi:DNA-binding CsgD family transcriptional regulator/tetratricopeptide (TPR) repeat protein